MSAFEEEKCKKICKECEADHIGKMKLGGEGAHDHGV